jgi:hypothetical protein
MYEYCTNTRSGGFKYWEYVLVYVDDVLVISHAPQKVMDMLSQRYTLKAGSVRPPSEYLGSDISAFTLPAEGDEPSKKCWSMSADTYVKRSVADVERTFEEIGQRLRTKVTTPLSSLYRPELDATNELDDRRANYFQGLIGVLRWIVELGRIDIMVAMLSRYLANPREGHLEEAFHVFAYLKAHGRSKVVFDYTSPNTDESRFITADWRTYYPDAAEAIPTNAPERRGNPIDMTCYVDADHAGCRVTRRSHTGILIFMQKAPIIWYSKRQNTVEASTFGSEFIAMKTAIEQVEAMRYNYV